MHEKCEREHLRVCNAKSRAKRAYQESNDKITSIEHQIVQLQAQLRDAKRTKRQAEQMLTRISHA